MTNEEQLAIIMTKLEILLEAQKNLPCNERGEQLARITQRLDNGVKAMDSKRSDLKFYITLGGIFLLVLFVYIPKIIEWVK